LEQAGYGGGAHSALAAGQASDLTVGPRDIDARAAPEGKRVQLLTSKILGVAPYRKPRVGPEYQAVIPQFEGPPLPCASKPSAVPTLRRPAQATLQACTSPRAAAQEGTPCDLLAFLDHPARPAGNTGSSAAEGTTQLPLPGTGQPDH
jgi:hypothetical protein